MSMPTEPLISQFGLTKHLVLKLVLPHVGLLVCTVLYVLTGAWIFSVIESYEIEGNCTQLKSDFASSLWDSRESTLEDWEEKMNTYVLKLYECRKLLDEKHNSTMSSLWRLPRSIFFAATTLTSIGYGDQAPSTTAGRVFSMIFIILGLPLSLITVADMAKFCSEGISYCYSEYLKIKFTLIKRFHEWKSGEKRGQSRAVLQISGDDTEVAEFLWVHLENARIVDIPVLLVFVLLIGYLAFGSVLICNIENWTYLEAFYFSLVSVLTIGFGDFVPQNSQYLPLSILYILSGIVLTTACVDLVGINYIKKIHLIGRKIDEVDPMIWLKRVQQERIRQMKKDAMASLFTAVSAVNRISLEPSQMKKRSFRLTDTTNFDFGGFENILSEINDEISAADKIPRPLNFRAIHSNANSITLAWDVLSEKGIKKSWFTLSYRRRNPSRRLLHSKITVIDFIPSKSFEVTGLETFTLYEFHLTQSTKFGKSTPVRTEEYTGP